MYICLNCGEVFEEPVTKSHREYFGECHGRVCWENVGDDYCPNCGDANNFEEAAECKVCGDYYAWDSSESTICHACLEEHATLDVCLEYGSEDKSEIELNDFLVDMFTVEQIEEILIRELRAANAISPLDLSKYINAIDKEHLGDMIAKGVKT